MAAEAQPPPRRGRLERAAAPRAGPPARPPARGSTRAKYARALHALRASAQPGRAAVSVRSHARAPHAALPAPACPRASSSLSLARAPTLLRPQALRGAGPQVPAGRPELFIGGKILDVPAARSARGRRAMLSAFRARRAPLLLTAVLSETWAAKGDHISFVIGPFHPRSGPPCNPGASGTEPPSRACWNQRSRRGTRAATSGAAWPAPPAAPACVILLQTSRRAGTRVAPAALRLPGSGFPGALISRVALGIYFCTTPLNGGQRARACSLLSPLCRLSVRRLLGLIGIRNPFNLQRSKLTSARVLGGVGEGRPGRGFQANRKH